MVEYISIKENIRERYRELLDNALDLIYVLDINGNFIDANDIALDTFGYKREEIAEITFKDLIDKEQLGKAYNALEEVKEKGRNQDYIEYKVKSNDGRFIYIKTYGIPLKENGKIYAILEIANDITEQKKDKTNLKKSEEKYRVISENANDMIAILNQKFEFEYINEKTFLDILGYSSDDIIGKSALKLAHPDDLERGAKALRYGFKYGEGIEETRIRHKNGHYIWVETKGRLFVDKNGENKAIVISRDITEHKRGEQKLKESEEKYRGILENMIEGYFEVDLYGNFTFVNKRTCEFLGYSREELLTMNFRQIVGQSHTQDVFESFNKVFRNEVINVVSEFEILNKDRTNAYIQTSIYLKHDSQGKKIGFYGLARDITERKEAEKLVKKEREKLRELDLIKRRLTTELSEELKNPISKISDVTNILLNSYKDQFDKNAQKLLQLIRKGGERSTSMIERIIDISRIELDKFELNKKIESLNKIVIESINQIYEELETREINLNLDVLEEFFAEVDKFRILQVYKYFLEDVIKKTPPRGNISVSLKRNNNFADMIIESGGIEVKEEEIPFELKYSKEIIEIHDGSVVKMSKVDEKRTYVIIKLPLIIWSDLLIHIYVIYKSGILLYDHPFVLEKEGKFDSLIISGGLIGTLSLLKEIIKGKKRIRTIDHGDREIMFDINQTEDIIFALIVKEDNIILREKLKTFINEFDREYADLIKDIKSTCLNSHIWKNLDKLIEKCFLS